MDEQMIKQLQKDNVRKRIMDFIPNNLGINLCSVEDIIVRRQKNGEIKKIVIDFIPEEPESKPMVGLEGAVLA
jgi:hypothetical protein